MRSRVSHAAFVLDCTYVGFRVLALGNVLRIVSKSVAVSKGRGREVWEPFLL